MSNKHWQIILDSCHVHMLVQVHVWCITDSLDREWERVLDVDV